MTSTKSARSAEHEPTICLLRCAARKDVAMLRVLAVASWLAVLVSSLVVMGCSSSSAPAQECSSAAVSFNTDVLPVFELSCGLSVSCHKAMNNASVEGLYLGQYKAAPTDPPTDPTTVFNQIVNVKSRENPQMNLVTPGDVENSFLWHKVLGDQNSNSTVAAGCAMATSTCMDCSIVAPCGSRMPDTTQTLEMTHLCTIKQWIVQGAMNN
jgi:hypothetical protein